MELGIECEKQMERQETEPVEEPELEEETESGEPVLCKSTVKPVDGTPLAPCGCPIRSYPPPAPEISELPCEASEENIPKLKDWIMK